MPSSKQGSYQKMPSPVKPRTGIFPTSITLLSSALGAGLFAFPLAYAKGGYLYSILVSLAFAVVMFITMSMMISASDATGCYSYGKLAERVLGIGGIFTSELCTFLSTFGAMWAYAILWGDLFPAILTSVLPVDPKAFYMQRWFIIAVVGFFVFQPLSWIQNLSSLKFTSLVSTISILFCVVVVIIRYFAPSPGSVPATEVTAVRGSLSMIQLLSSLCFGFSIHMNGPTLFSSIKYRSLKRMLVSVGITVVGLCVLFCLCGLFGYFTFGTQLLTNPTSGNILNVYPSKDFIAMAGRIASLVTVTFCFPVQMIPNRLAFMNSVQMLRKMWIRRTRIKVRMIPEKTWLSTDAINSVDDRESRKSLKSDRMSRKQIKKFEKMRLQPKLVDDRSDSEEEGEEDENVLLEVEDRLQFEQRQRMGMPSNVETNGFSGATEETALSINPGNTHYGTLPPTSESPNSVASSPSPNQPGLSSHPSLIFPSMASFDGSSGSGQMLGSELVTQSFLLSSKGRKLQPKLLAWEPADERQSVNNRLRGDSLNSPSTQPILSYKTQTDSRPLSVANFSTLRHSESFNRLQKWKEKKICCFKRETFITLVYGTIMTIIACILGIFVTKVNLVFDLIGSTSGIVNAFIMPCILFIRVRSKPKKFVNRRRYYDPEIQYCETKNRERIETLMKPLPCCSLKMVLAVVLVIFGVVLMLLGLAMAVIFDTDIASKIGL